jgi:hypothetical protein
VHVYIHIYTYIYVYIIKRIPLYMYTYIHIFLMINRLLVFYYQTTTHFACIYPFSIDVSTAKKADSTMRAFYQKATETNRFLVWLKSYMRVDVDDTLAGAVSHEVLNDCIYIYIYIYNWSSPLSQSPIKVTLNDYLYIYIYMYIYTYLYRSSV